LLDMLSATPYVFALYQVNILIHIYSLNIQYFLSIIDCQKT
jgi:hypothetical protein